MTGREVNQVDQARRLGKEITDLLIEHNQRCDMLALDRTRFLINTKDRKAEVFFLSDVFVVEEGKIFKVKDGSLTLTDLEELNKALQEKRSQTGSVNIQALEVLKKEFKDFKLEF